jgi:ABC-type sugar transport system substrate-binding protein
VIVAEQTANTAELGLKVTESILQSYPDITGFVCQNDTAGLGCFEALTAAGREAGSTFVVGVDGLQEAFQKIAAGTMYVGSVDNNPEGKAELILQTVARVMKEGPIADMIYVHVVPVTIENVQDFIHD